MSPTDDGSSAFPPQPPGSDQGSGGGDYLVGSQVFGDSTGDYVRDIETGNKWANFSDS